MLLTNQSFSTKDLKIEILKKENLDSIKSLLKKYDFSDYRYYRVFKKDVLDVYLYSQIRELLNQGGWVIVAKKGLSFEGALVLNKLFWGKDVFGMNMAEFKYLISIGVCKNKIKIISGLLSYVFKLCRDNNIGHLSCRVNTNDHATVHCLEDAGFKIMETQVTYLFNKIKHKVPRIKELCHVRDFKKEDKESLVNIVKGSFTGSRFFIDSSIPTERKGKFYIKWVEDCAEGLLADRIIVAEKNNNVVGFLSYRVNRELEKISGIKIGGQGLSAGLPKNKGVYISLMMESIRDAVLMYDFAEYDTQITNFEVIKIWQRLGLDFVRSKYAFHKYLGKKLLLVYNK